MGVPTESDESARTAAEERPTQHAPLEPVNATLRAASAVGERIGKYVIERTIGHGGMGIVVAARHETLDETVAIKLLHPKAAKDALQVERFVREARSTVRIKSEHVVRVLDAGADGVDAARPFIVMELLEGTRPRATLLATCGPAAPDDGCRLHAFRPARRVGGGPRARASSTAISSRRTSSSRSAPTARRS